MKRCCKYTEQAFGWHTVFPAVGCNNPDMIITHYQYHLGTKKHKGKSKKFERILKKVPRNN